MVVSSFSGGTRSPSGEPCGLEFADEIDRPDRMRSRSSHRADSGSKSLGSSTVGVKAIWSQCYWG